MESHRKQGIPAALAAYRAEQKRKKASRIAAGKKGAQIRLSSGQERGGVLADHTYHPINIDPGAQMEPSSPVEVRTAPQSTAEPHPPDSAPRSKRKRKQAQPYDPSKFGAVRVTSRHNGKVKVRIRNIWTSTIGGITRYFIDIPGISRQDIM